jgi:hypothetical protein
MTPILESIYTNNRGQPPTLLACSTNVSWQLETNGGHRVGQAPGVEFDGNRFRPAAARLRPNLMVSVPRFARVLRRTAVSG